MTDILISKKNVIFDSQILSTLMSCERLTDFRFNMNLVPITGKGKSLEMGSMIHVILEKYYKSVRDSNPRAKSIEIGLNAGEEYRKEMTNTSIEDSEHVIETAKQYFLHYNNEYWTPVIVEKVLQDIIYEDDDVRVLWKAKFDLQVDTNQGIYPVDHKSMSRRGDTLSLNNQFMGQCVLSKTNAVIINKIGWQKTLKPSEKFTRPMINYSNDRLNEWKSLVGYYAKYWIDISESGFYPPRFSHCDKYSGCMFRSVCESDRGMREEELKRLFTVGEAWEPTDD